MSKQDADREFDKIAVPESRTIARDTLLKPIAKVDHQKPHNPLLFIGGDNDHIFPSSFTKRIAGAYKHKGSVVDFKSFAGRSHYICGEEGWQEVADYVIDWIEKL